MGRRQGRKEGDAEASGVEGKAPRVVGQATTHVAGPGRLLRRRLLSGKGTGP